MHDSETVQCEIINGDLVEDGTHHNVCPWDECCPRPAALGNILPSGKHYDVFHLHLVTIYIVLMDSKNSNVERKRVTV